MTLFARRVCVCVCVKYMTARVTVGHISTRRRRQRGNDIISHNTDTTTPSKNQNTATQQQKKKKPRTTRAVRQMIIIRHIIVRPAGRLRRRRRSERTLNSIMSHAIVSKYTCGGAVMRCSCSSSCIRATETFCIINYQHSLFPPTHHHTISHTLARAFASVHFSTISAR